MPTATTATPTPQTSVPGVGMVSNPSAYGFSPGANTTQPVTTPAPATPIAADGLTGKATPITIPQATPTPTATPTVGAPQGTSTDANGNATYTPPTTNPSTSVSEQIKSALANLGGQLGMKSSFTQQAQNDAQLAQKTQQATSDYNAYNAAKLALQQKIANIQTNPTGMTKTGVDETVANETRIGNANLANLAIIAQSSQGLLDAAQKTITDKVNAQFQPIQDQIDFLTKFATVNNNDLTESEKTKIQQKADQLKTDNASVQTAAHDIHQALLAGNAPASSYSAVDAITEKYTSGQITASEAQSQMYAAAGKYASAMAKKQDMTSGTGGNYSSDFYQTYNSIPDSQKNTPQAQFGGLTKTGLLNAAQLYLSENGKIPSIGLGSSGNQTSKREAIINLGGAIADSLGMTLPQISAMYKANSSSATQIVNRVAKIDAVSNSLANQFPRLADLAGKVSNLKISEQDLNATQAQIAKKFNNVDANNYIELLNTVRADYSAMQAAVAGSRGAQYFSQTAQQAIPIGASPEVYQGLQQTILLSATNAQKGTQDEANALIGNIGSNSIGRAQTVQSNGQSWNVGQVYQDASGSKWTVDTNGNWSKQ